MTKVTIQSSIGSNGMIIELPLGTGTWGQLKTILTQKGVQHEEMKALIGGQRQALESDDDLIPAIDFTLFLVPMKTKSGN